MENTDGGVGLPLAIPLEGSLQLTITPCSFHSQGILFFHFLAQASLAEPVTVEVNFLSVDLSPINSVNEAAWQDRFLAGQGKPWDLMAWSFTDEWSTTYTMGTPKTALQLCQEGAAVISLGGGFQIYFRQNKDISFQPASFNIIKEVADFILPGREFCKGIQLIPQLGMLYSTDGWKHSVNVICNGDTGKQEGILWALLDGQLAVEEFISDRMKIKMKDFPVIVVPEWERLKPEMITAIKDNVNNGGRLLEISADATKMFDDILGTKELNPSSIMKNGLGYDRRFVQLTGKCRSVICLSGTEFVAEFYTTTDFRNKDATAATISRCGKGTVAGIYADLGNTCQNNASLVIQDLLIGITDRLFPERIVKVERSHKAHVVLGKIEDRLLVYLINISGDHANPNISEIENIPVLRT